VDGDTITTATLDDARERCVALDQRAHLTEGARTWPVFYDGGQRGQMTRLPSGRGAVCFGADSLWGWWGEDALHIDEKEALRVDPNDDGTSWAYREDGEVVYYDGDEEDGE
jgi:hypothetical protein